MGQTPAVVLFMSEILARGGLMGGMPSSSIFIARKIHAILQRWMGLTAASRSSDTFGDLLALVVNSLRTSQLTFPSYDANANLPKASSP